MTLIAYVTTTQYATSYGSFTTSRKVEERTEVSFDRKDGAPQWYRSGSNKRTKASPPFTYGATSELSVSHYSDGYSSEAHLTFLSQEFDDDDEYVGTEEITEGQTYVARNSTYSEKTKKQARGDIESTSDSSSGDLFEHADIRTVVQTTDHKYHTNGYETTTTESLSWTTYGSESYTSEIIAKGEPRTITYADTTSQTTYDTQVTIVPKSYSLASLEGYGEYATRHANTEYKTKSLTLKGHEDLVKVFKNVGLNRTISAEQQSHTYWLLTSTSFTGSATLTWNETDDLENKGFVNISDSYVMSERQPFVTVTLDTASSGTTINNVYSEQTDNSTREMGGATRPAFTGEFEDYDGEYEEESKEVTFGTTASYTTEIESVGGWHAFASVVSKHKNWAEMARDYGNNDTTTNTNGGLDITFTESSRTHTWLSSTITDNFHMWGTSQKYMGNSEGDFGSPFKPVGGGVTINTIELEETVVEGQTQTIQTGGNLTDTKQFETEEETSARPAHQGYDAEGNTYELIPFFTQVIPTTNTAEQILFRKNWWDNNKLSSLSTKLYYTPPETREETWTTYVVEEDENVTYKTTIVEFTATSEKDITDVSKVPPRTTGSKSSEATFPELDSNDETTGTYTRTGWEPKTAIPKMTRAYGTYTYGTNYDGIGFNSLGTLNNLDLEVQTQWWTTDTYFSPVFPRMVSSSKFYTEEFSRENEIFVVVQEDTVDGVSVTIDSPSSDDWNEDFLSTQYITNITEIEYKGLALYRPARSSFGEVQVITGSTQKLGFPQATTRGLDEASGWHDTDVPHYSLISYSGLERSDFTQAQEAHYLTTQGVYQDWVNFQNQAQYMWVTEEVKTTLTRTFTTYTTSTIYESDGYLDVSNPYGTHIGQTDDPLPVIYSDSCDNTYIFGYIPEYSPDYQGGDGQGSGDGGSNFGAENDWGIAYDSDGNLIDPYADGANPYTPDDGEYESDDDYDREAECGPFTFTYITTTHKSSMTYTDVFETTIREPLSPYEQTPYFRPPYSYYGNHNMHELNARWDYDPFYHWNANDENSKQCFPWFYYYNNMYENGLQDFRRKFFNAFGINLQAPPILWGSQQMPLGMGIFEEPIGNWHNASFGRQGNTYATKNSWMQMFHERKNFADFNTQLSPFYHYTSIGGGALQFNEIIGNSLVDFSDFIDNRGAKAQFGINTKKFTLAPWAITDVDADKSISTNEMQVAETNYLQAEFFYESQFYKKFLEQTSCTLSFSEESTDTNNWYYITASRKVSSLIEGQDGKYRPVYESGTSDTERFSVSLNRQHQTYPLYGTHYALHQSAQLYKMPDAFKTRYGAKCCGCYNKTFLAGRHSREANTIIGNLSVGFLGLAYAHTSHTLQEVAHPMVISTADLKEDNTQWGASSLSLGSHSTDLSGNIALSYEIPYMIVVDTPIDEYLALKDYDKWTIQGFLSVQYNTKINPCSKPNWYYGDVKYGFDNRHHNARFRRSMKAGGVIPYVGAVEVAPKPYMTETSQQANLNMDNFLTPY